MTAGPGKYDEVATKVREQTEADAVIVIVLSGNRGSGMSCQTRAPISSRRVAEVLRSAADSIASLPLESATKCPYCGLIVLFREAELQVLHEAPICERFTAKMKELNMTPQPTEWSATVAVEEPKADA